MLGCSLEIKVLCSFGSQEAQENTHQQREHTHTEKQKCNILKSSTVLRPMAQQDSMEPENLGFKQRSQMTEAKLINPERRYSGEEHRALPAGFKQQPTAHAGAALRVCAALCVLCKAIGDSCQGDKWELAQRNTTNTQIPARPDDLLPERQDQPQRH